MKNHPLHDFSSRAGTALRVRRIPACRFVFLLSFAFVAHGADVVPTDIQMPGTQPLGVDNPPTLTSVGNCGCHGGFTGNPNPEDVPVFGWMGSMMANAGRDPLFWSTLAIAEQDFLPGTGGVGDLCLRCHSVKGWIEGRSTPTNGSGLDPASDEEGIMCEFCHLLTNPDQVNTIPNPPEGSYIEEQNAPFVAYDEATGEGYYGGAEYVLNSGETRLGPFDAPAAKHPVIQSAFHRDARLCGTCHDVSNPAVGDLAHNHGAQAPLPPGGFSGVPGAPVVKKAAFNNPPHTFGVVERTFSEWKAGALDDLPVSGFPALPADLRVPGGALERAYRAALHGFCSGSPSVACNVDANCPSGETCVTVTADFEDGTTRYFTCQTCHLAPSGGKAAKQGQYRVDLPGHDLTGGSYWVQDAILHQDGAGTLRFGTGLTTAQVDALAAGRIRAEGHLRSAASLSAVQVGDELRVTVTNLSGHKLITGYPEGRRMWLAVAWYGLGDNLIFENGGYGPIGNTVQDLSGTFFDVESIIDPSETKVYEAKPAMTREWAEQLLGLGYPADMVLEWDRFTNSPKHDLAELASGSLGSMLHTFHFVLNNALYKDSRIPPFRMDYDIALARNALPVPDTQYGNPGPGGTFHHWDEVNFPIPAGAARAEAKLYYQSTSWEYVQFLWKQNEGTDPFLGSEGVNLLDAWLDTDMSRPFRMAEATVTSLVPPGNNPPGLASGPSQAQMIVTGYDPGTGAVTLAYEPACDATGHTIHYGSLADVRNYGWAKADCTFDVSGTATFVPDPSVGENIFWVIVGGNPDYEGSYGTDSHGAERPPNTASAGVCLRPQSWVTFCE